MHKIAEPYEQAQNDYKIYCEILKQFGEKEYMAFSEGKSEMEWIKQFYDASKKKADASKIKMPEFEEFWKKGFVKFEIPKHAYEYVAMEEFRKNPIINRLGTPSGRIEVVSKKIAKAALDDCPAHPTWMEPMEWLGNAQKTQKYPLNLITPHPKYRLHGQLNNTWLRSLEEIDGREPVWMHPKDAEARGLKNGDVVRVFNDRGAALAGLIVTENVKQSVVRMQEGGWWDPLFSSSGDMCVHGNANVLVPNEPSSKLACGNQATALVQIEKFEGELPPLAVFSQPKFGKRS